MTPEQAAAMERVANELTPASRASSHRSTIRSNPPHERPDDE